MHYRVITHGTNLGQIQGDTIRNIEGSIYPVDGGHDYGQDGAFKPLPAYRRHIFGTAYGQNSLKYSFNASRVVPTSEENRPVNVGVKYLIKAE